MTVRQSKTGLGGGFPHSDIHGSKLVRSSPWLFAAYHVLHRLRVPRHSPNALMTLDRSHYQCPPQTVRPEILQRNPSKASGVPVRGHTDIVRPMTILARSNMGRKDQYNTRFARQTVGGPLILADDIRTSLLFTMSEIRPLSAKPQNAAKRSFDWRERPWPNQMAGGARRNRTDDLLLAKQALSQLSYGPVCRTRRPPAPDAPMPLCPAPGNGRAGDKRSRYWWAWVDSNYRPHPYQGCALTN